MKRLLALILAFGLIAAACGGDDDDPVATGAPETTDDGATEEEASDDGAMEEEVDDGAMEEEVDDGAMEEEADDGAMEEEPSDDGAMEEGDADDAFPVTIAAGNGDVTIDARPERIVSISTVATENLFAVGAGDQVIAVDDLSNHPPEAPVSDLSGFSPSVEAIAALEPDLVFLSFDPGDVVAGLEALGIPTILHGTANSLDEAYAQIEQTGAATGHLAAAVELVAQMQAEIEEAVASAPDFEVAPRIFHEVSFDLFSATSTTFIGQLYAMFGVENIADPADEDGFGFPQLAAEYVLEQDPDIIFLGDVLYGENAATVAARPGWDALTAVGGGNIVELDTDIASRWGPRIPELMRQIAAGLEAWAGVPA